MNEFTDRYDLDIESLRDNPDIIRISSPTSIFEIVKVPYDKLTSKRSNPSDCYHIEEGTLTGVYILLSELPSHPILAYVGKGDLTRRPFSHDAGASGNENKLLQTFSSKRVEECGHGKKMLSTTEIVDYGKWDWAYMIYIRDRFNGEDAQLALEHLISETVFHDGHPKYLRCNMSGEKTLGNTHGKKIHEHFGELLYMLSIFGVYSASEHDNTIESEPKEEAPKPALEDSKAGRVLNRVPSDVVFYFTQPHDEWYGKMRVINGDCVVLAGSKLGPMKEYSSSDNVTSRVKNLRESSDIIRQVHEGQEQIVLQSDSEPIESPSSAAGLVNGGSANGWTRWVDENGKTLDEYARGL